MENESIIFTNSFGTVSDKRIIVNYKNGSEDIPLKQVSSVALERKRSMVIAMIYFIIAVGILFFVFIAPSLGSGEMMITLVAFLFCSLAGVAYYVGNHQIKISAAGKDRKPIKVEMSKTKEGRAFYESIRQQIVSG